MMCCSIAILPSVARARRALAPITAVATQQPADSFQVSAVRDSTGQRLRVGCARNSSINTPQSVDGDCP
jgi:hypothetical protein